MFIIISTVISLVALGLTCYQLYLQRLHNEKSLKPLGQIELGDRKKYIHVYVQNKGVGPMIVDKLTFTKSDNIYDDITDCLNLDPKSFWHGLIDSTVNKVISTDSHLIVFKKNIEHCSAEEIVSIKKQLSLITLKVDCRDIYDNKFSIVRNLEWFSRYMRIPNQTSEQHKPID